MVCRCTEYVPVSMFVWRMCIHRWCRIHEAEPRKAKILCSREKKRRGGSSPPKRLCFHEGRWWASMQGRVDMSISPFGNSDARFTLFTAYCRSIELRKGGQGSRVKGQKNKPTQNEASGEIKARVMYVYVCVHIAIGHGMHTPSEK